MPTSVSASGGMSSLLPSAQLKHRGSLVTGLPVSYEAATSLAAPSPVCPRPVVCVPLIHDNLTFDGRQATRLRDIEKRMETELKRKKRNFEREVEHMREEFLTLLPSEREWGSDELLVDPLVIRRRGSTDVLNPRKMKTMFTTSPESERRFQIRFDVSGFLPDSIRVYIDVERITIKAVKMEEHPVSEQSAGEESGNGIHTEGSKAVRKEYCRKIERPKDVDHTKLKCRLFADGILLLQSSCFQHMTSKSNINAQKSSAGSSPTHSHSFQGSPQAGSSRAKSPVVSPSTEQLTPSTMKLGVPIFREEPGGIRRMHLAVDVGPFFKPKEITVQAIKENRILIKAKHEERTSERLSKSKYSKEFELPEKIDTHTLRGGLCGEGRLVVGAFVKGHCGDLDLSREHSLSGNSHVFIEQLDPNSEMIPCNVLNLALFPPKMSSSASSASILSHSNGTSA